LPGEDVQFRRLNKNHGAIKLPKIGEVRCRGFRKLGGKLRSVTFRRKAGKWHVSVAWDREIPDPPRIEEPAIGIDRGVAVFAATSVGELIDPLNAFDGIKDKLAKLQQKLARKVKFSSNWFKLKGKISRLRMHEANARKDFLHKETTKLAKSHGVYRMEKLRVRNMTASAKGTVEEPGMNVAQKAGINRSILDQGWAMFATFLGYKEQERGGRVEFTPAPYTSQRCPRPSCGHCSPANRPTRDLFRCEVCGYENHADVVGAINVSQGRILPVEPPKRIRRRVGKRKPVEGIKHAA
jgi:putative transposase